MSRRPRFLLGQLSDPHITEPDRLVGGRFDTAPFLVAAVEHLNGLDPQPDVVIASGDLVDRGRPTEYDRLRSLLAPLESPLLVLPGNHDGREALRDAFRDQPWGPTSPRLHYLVDDYPVRLVVLDSLLEGRYEGALGEAQLAWLDETLAGAPDRVTVVAVHHPPFLTGIDHMDEMGLTDRDAFAAVVARHPQVERVICGHLHRPITVRWAGTTAMTVPSVAHQVRLDLEPDSQPHLVLEPPSVALHLWRPDTGLVSHLSPVPAPP